MDYPNQTRNKIWGTAKVVEDEPELLKKLHDSTYRGKPERVILFTIEAWAVNCRQHVQPRFTSDEMERALEVLQDRIAELESENTALRAEQQAPEEAY